MRFIDLLFNAAKIYSFAGERVKIHAENFGYA
jgi:hypothetical protein